MAITVASHDIVTAGLLADAALGHADACYDLGIAHSSGSGGVPVDLIEAHKWFNLAAQSGLEAAQHARADISFDMTAREIATAQRLARDWLAINRRMAA